MGQYHSKIMNIPTEEHCVKVLYETQDEKIAYKEGHRDARHVAAEIALEAEREIEELKEIVSSLEDNLAFMENYCDDLQSQLL